MQRKQRHLSASRFAYAKSRFSHTEAQLNLIKGKQCVLLCETKAKTSCAVTTDMPSHNAAHVIYATKALGSFVCMFVLMIVSHETAMVMMVHF